MDAQTPLATDPAPGNGKHPPLITGTSREARMFLDNLMGILSTDVAMDLGTANPSREIREPVPHHLVDVADPDEPFSAARFQMEADRAIREIHERRIGDNIQRVVRQLDQACRGK